MIRINLTEEELLNLKTVCDYLFFDQYKDTATFTQFEKSFAFFFPQKNVSLENVFKEICGPKKKYITFPRMLNAFLTYKNFPGKASLELKNFFGQVFKNVLKKPEDIIGPTLQKTKKMTTANCKNKDGITKMTVLGDDSEPIRGLKIEYDDSFNAKLFDSKKVKEYKTKMEIMLDLLDNADKDKTLQQMISASNEQYYRDNITHVFGTFSNKIEFIGFKCRSGKVGFVGKPKGDPFLFGEYGKQFHYMKAQMTDVFTQIQLYFKDSARGNSFLKLSLNEITEDFILKEPLVAEEAHLAKLTDEKTIQKLVTNPLVKDDEFFQSKKEDKENLGNNFNEVVDREPRKWQIDESKQKEDGSLVDIDEILGKEEKKKKKIVTKSAKPRKVNALQSGNPKANNALQSTKPKEKEENWDGVSAKKLKPKQVIKNKKNYRKLLEKVDSDIQNEIKKEAGKEKKEGQDNFYEQYLSRHKDFVPAKVDSPRKEQNVKEVEKEYEQMKEKEREKNKLKSIEQKAYKKGVAAKIAPPNPLEEPKITSKSIQSKPIVYELHRKEFSDNVFFEDPFKRHPFDNFFEEEEKNFDEDLFEHTKKKNEDKYNKNKWTYEYFEKEIEEDPQKVKEAQKIWINLSKKLEKSQGVHILQTIGAVIKALHVLRASEDNERSRMSIREKMKLYHVLEENQLVVDFLTKRPVNDEVEEPEDELPDEEEGVVVEEPDDDDIEENDIGELNRKLTIIEQMFPRVDDEKKAKLRRMYEIYKKKKNELIEAQEEEIKNALIKETKINVDEIKKQEQQKRFDKMKEETDYIKQLQSKAIDFAVDNKIQQAGRKRRREHRRRIHDKNDKISIASMPTPKRIYKSQQIYNGKGEFIDDLFPPEKKSLCPVDKKGNWILPPDVTEEDIDGWDEFKWCRAEDIFGSEDFQVFHDGILDDDIMQGALGDCYFLSAIAALCQFPKLIEKLFFFKEKSEEHCYGVYFNINGQWELVLVDDMVPCTGRYSKKFAFSSANGNELWVVLLEKAWAKINGSYAKVGCGGLPHEVFDVITEAYNEKFDIFPRYADRIWDGLMRGQEKGFIMTAGTSCDPNLDTEEVGLVPGHAYTILGIHEVGGERLIHIRNPWGAGEWMGEWCDTSDKWTPELREQVGLQEGDKDEGEFFMSFDDYLKYFCMMGICKLHEDYKYCVNKITRREVNGPAVSKVTVNSNDVHVYFQLHQKNPRIILKDGTYQNPVTTYMLLVDENYHFIDSVCKSEMSLCIEQTLKKGTYYLVTDINYRYVNNGKLLGYNISSYASEEVPIQTVTQTVNPEPIITAAVCEYAKDNITPTKEKGGAVVSYISKAYSKDWPFVIAYFENKTKNDVTVTFDVTCRGMKSFAFYNDSNAKDTDSSLAKVIPGNDSGLVLIMNYSFSSLFSFSYGIDCEMDNKALDETLFAEEPEAIDEDGTINQYVHEERNGYLIGLENKKKIKLKMKLEIEGLEFTDKEFKGKDVCVFEIDKNSKKVFSLTTKKGYYGDINFGFDYA